MRITYESSASTAELYAALWIATWLIAGGVAVDAYAQSVQVVVVPLRLRPST